MRISSQCVVLLVAATAGCGAQDDASAMARSMVKVQIVSQNFEVKLNKLSAKVIATFSLEAKEDAPKAVFAFPLPATASEPNAVKVMCDGLELSVLPYVIPAPEKKNDPDAMKDLAKNQQEKWFAERIRHYFDAAFGHSTGLRGPNHWYAYKLPFTAGQKRSITVEAALLPMALADLKSGPCYAFRVPIRLGRVWGSHGKISAKVTLDETVSPEAVALAMPIEIKRAGRLLTLALDNTEPDDDLYVVLSGKLP